MSNSLNSKIIKLQSLLDDILIELEALPPKKLDQYKELVTEKIYDFTDKLSLTEEATFETVEASDSDYDYYNEDEIEHYVDDETP